MKFRWIKISVVISIIFRNIEGKTVWYISITLCKLNNNKFENIHIFELRKYSNMLICLNLWNILSFKNVWTCVYVWIYEIFVQIRFNLIKIQIFFKFEKIRTSAMSTKIYIKLKIENILQNLVRNFNIYNIF